jgi:hypothetical protein
MEDMNMTISNQYSELLRQSGGKDDEILGRISEMNQTVNSRMDQVFQRVSDGKQLLASALLTKGVNINKDATFIQFAEAIRNTPQQLVIGVEKLPGTVSYEYHHHTDKDGKLKGSEQVGANEKGGCYTVPVYHVHMGDPYHGGGCYSIPRYHQHSGSCYASVSYDTSTDHVLYDLDRENGELFHMYRCDVCGSEFKSTNGGHKHYETHLVCGRNGGTVEGYVTGCGMTTDTVTGYRPGCGLSEGQIVAAYIVYEGGSDKDTSQMQELRTSQMYTEENLPGTGLEESKAVVQAEGISYGGVLPETEKLPEKSANSDAQDNTESVPEQENTENSSFSENFQNNAEVKNTDEEQPDHAPEAEAEEQQN